MPGFYIEELSWESIILRLLLSLVSGMLIGLERKYTNHPAGMKTHAIVCIGSALASLVTVEMGFTVSYLGFTGDSKIDMSRIASGVLTGIGFVGAGAIMKSKDGLMVTGLTTAATLWVTACLGLAIGMGYLKMSLVALLTIFIANILLRYLEIKLRLSTSYTKCILVTTREKNKAIEYLDELFSQNKITVESFELRSDESVSENANSVYYLRYTVKLTRAVRFDLLLREIAVYENALQVSETMPV